MTGERALVFAIFASIMLAAPVGAQVDRGVEATSNPVLIEHVETSGGDRIRQIRQEHHRPGVHLEGLSPEERNWLRQMDPEARREKRIERFESMSPEERRLLRRRDFERKRLLREHFEAVPESVDLLSEEERRQRIRDRFRNLPREERQRLQRRFRALDPEDRERLRERMRAESPRARRQMWAGDGDVDPDQRRALREQLKNLSERERDEIRERLRHYRNLPPEEQGRLQERLAEIESMSAKRREQLRDRAKTWRSFPEEKRNRLRAQMRRLNELEPEERLELLDSVLESEASEFIESTRPSD